MLFAFYKSIFYLFRDYFFNQMGFPNRTTNFNDSEIPTLDKIYAAYRCRGNVNFVVNFFFLHYFEFNRSNVKYFSHFRCLVFLSLLRRLTQVSFPIAVFYLKTRSVYLFIFYIFEAGFVDTLYSWSAFNTEEIGNVVAESLKILIQTYPIEKIHLIGE